MVSEEANLAVTKNILNRFLLHFFLFLETCLNPIKTTESLNNNISEVGRKFSTKWNSLEARNFAL